MTQLYTVFIVNTSTSDASLCSPSSASLERLPVGQPAGALFWLVGILVLNTKTASVSHRKLCIALMPSLSHSICIDTCFIAHVSARVQGSFKKNYASISPICIGYNSVIDFLSPVPLLLFIVLHCVDPDANVSSVVVRRAMCRPPDPERRLPGLHSRTA